MKKIFTLLLLVVGFSQFVASQDFDARLLGKYSKQEIKKMQESNPNEYQFLVNALDKGLFISEIPAEKAKDVVFDGTLKIDPKGTHTFITLKKEILERYQYYKIEGTNMMVVILPRIFLDPARAPKK
jgi:hypothetical protein